eukprot:2228315-Prymnesium_polylepis.1
MYAPQTRLPSRGQIRRAEGCNQCCGFTGIRDLSELNPQPPITKVVWQTTYHTTLNRKLRHARPSRTGGSRGPRRTAPDMPARALVLLLEMPLHARVPALAAAAELNLKLARVGLWAARRR